MLSYSRYDNLGQYKDKERYSKEIVDSKAHFQLFVTIAQGSMTLTELRHKLKKSNATIQEQLLVLEHNGAINRSLSGVDKPKYIYKVNYGYFLKKVEEMFGKESTQTTKKLIEKYFKEYYPNDKSFNSKSKKSPNLLPAQTFLDLVQKLPYYALTNRSGVIDDEFAIQGWYLLFLLVEVMEKVAKKDRVLDLSFFQKFKAKKGQRLKDTGARFWFKPEIQVGMKSLIKFHLDNLEDDKNGKRN